MDKAFVLHYKNASNSNPWQTSEYNESKTKALNNVLNEFVYGDN